MPIGKMCIRDSFSGLRFEGNGRIVYEYRVYYYSASGILLYINNENAGDV